MRWCKEHKDLDRFGPLERNTLHPVWLFVFPLVLFDVFGRGPYPPLYNLWNRVTWKVLAGTFRVLLRVGRVVSVYVG
jgi:hypothetical protein